MASRIPWQARFFADYDRSWQVRRAVERRRRDDLGARRHIPEELRLRYPRIFWREIVQSDHIEILSVFHGAPRWPEEPSD